MNNSQHACWLDHMPMAAGADRAAFGRYAARLLQSPAAPAFPVDALAPAAYLAGASAGASAYSGKFFFAQQRAPPQPSQVSGRPGGVSCGCGAAAGG